jgi:hypothetical protein
MSRPLLTLRGDRSPALAVQIPAAADSPFLFRREFIHAIRAAIGAAQIAGDIDAQTAVECMKALPSEAA